MICGSATEKMRTSDFRRRTSAGLRGRCMRRPRSARVARSLKSEVGSHHLVIAQGLSPVRLFLTQSRRGAEAAELCVRIYGGPVPVESSYVGTAAWCETREELGAGINVYSRVKLNLRLVSWDMLSYGKGFFRDMVPSYTAARYLQSEKSYSMPFIFLKWNEIGAWEVFETHTPCDTDTSIRRVE